MSKGTRLVNTLGELAQKMGYDLRTLNDQIDLYPDLAEQVKPFRDGKKRIYPPLIIENIKAKLGEP